MENNEPKKEPTVVDLNNPVAKEAAQVKIDPVPVEPVKPFEYADQKGPASVQEVLDSVGVDKQDTAESAEKPAPEKEPVKEEPAPVKEPEPEQPVDDSEKSNPEQETAPEEGTDSVLEMFRAPTKKEAVSAEEDERLDLLFNQVVLGKQADIQDYMRKIYPTDDEVKRAAADDNSFLNKVMTATAHGWSTGDRVSISAVLKNNNKLGDRLTCQDECGIPAIPDGRPKKLSHASTYLTGKEARLVTAALLGGVRRVNLLNSGFWVVVKAPSIADLTEIFNTIDIEGKEIGRSIGTHFALISDMYLKQKFLEVIMKHGLIIDSNFSDFKKNGAFARNVSYHDYETLVHAIVSLMSRNGLRARLMCPACKTETVVDNFDISASKFVNRDLFSTPQRTVDGKLLPTIAEWWSQTRTKEGNPIYRSEEDLKLYREHILGFTRVIKQKMQVYGSEVDVELDLAVPTMQQYFRVGDLLIQKLNETITGIANGDADKAELVKASLAIHGYQLIAPWVRNMRIMKPGGQEVEVTTDDPEVIVEYLDQSIQEGIDSDMFDELHQFVADGRFNYFGSFLIECPNCHTKPESELDNFFPMEMQTVFFGLSFRRSRAGR